MESIGIDLGAAQSHVCVYGEAGTKELLTSIKTKEIGNWLRRRAPSRVVMESCTQSRAVAMLAGEAKHEVVVIPAHYVRSLGVGRRGIKTDKKDAEVLAQVGYRNVDLPTVHIRESIAEERRELITARELLIKNRSAIALHLKSTLRSRLSHVKGRANPQNFTTVIRKQFLDDERGVSAAQEALLQSYDAMTAQISELDVKVRELVKHDATCQRLMTMPGVGPVVSLAFSSYLDNAQRFADADKLGSYLALVPGEMTTGGKIKRTGVIHAGPGYLKSLLVQSAWSMFRYCPSDPAVLWAKSIAARRGKRIAIVALTRKIATMLWSMWKHGTNYDPARGATIMSGVDM
jgi:transposase